MNTLTDEQLALALDPQRDMPGWWDWKCLECGASDYDKNMGVCRCRKCRCEWEIRGSPQPVNIPPLTTSRVAAFEHVWPVLEATGCGMFTRKTLTVIYLGALSDGKMLAHEATYPAATTAAAAWLLENDRERWDAAGKEVGRAL